MNKKKKTLCQRKGCENKGAKPHGCPYVLELAEPDDKARDVLCNCCDECAEQCAADI